MNITHLSFHGCIRAHKEARELIKRGYSVHFCASFISPTHDASPYSSIHLWNSIGPDGQLDPRQLTNEIRILDKSTDIFHVHNEPNWIFQVVRENTKKPIIWDIHDWTSLRTSSPPLPSELEAEKYAIEHADAFVVPSQGYLTKIRSLSQKPSILLYSMVNPELFPVPSTKKLPGVVYEGGLKGNTDILLNYPYRDWASFAKEAVNTFPNGDKFYFYSANGEENFSGYTHEKIQVEQPVGYLELLRRLSQHTAGIVGAPYPVDDFKDSIPNKLFEYVAAGIPCLVINSPEATAFVEKHGLGVGIRDATEVRDALSSLTDHHVRRDRWGFTMDREILKLMSLYEEVQCSFSPKDIRQTGSYVHVIDARSIISDGSS